MNSLGGLSISEISDRVLSRIKSVTAEVKSRAVLAGCSQEEIECLEFEVLFHAINFIAAEASVGAKGWGKEQDEISVSAKLKLSKLKQ